MHKVRGDVAALRWSVQSIDRWQKHYEPIIEDLREADRIADAVAKRMQETQQIGLTRVQRLAAIGGVGIAFAALATDLAFRIFAHAH